MNVLKNRIDSLVEELSRHMYNYYTLDAPTISDAEYDSLYDELVSLEKETGYVRPDSPTQRIGGEILPGLRRYGICRRFTALTRRGREESF